MTNLIWEEVNSACKILLFGEAQFKRVFPQKCYSLIETYVYLDIVIDALYNYF